MKSAVLNKIGLFTVLFSVIAIPLFFLPITSEFYEYNKNFLLLALSSCLLLTLVASFIVDKQVRVTRSPLGLPFLLLSTVWLISTIVRTPNRLDALLDPTQTATILALAVFFFAATHFIKTKKDLDLITHVAIISAGMISISSLLWTTGLMEKVLPSGPFKSVLWTPTGNLLTTLAYTISFLPFIGIVIARQKSQSKKTMALVLALFLTFISSILSAYRIFKDPNARPFFLSQSTSWAVALEALKASPLLGTGPSTYLSDFTRFRPISYNLTPNWAIRFTSSTNYYLQLVATVGILGIAAFTLLAARTIGLFAKSFRTNFESPSHHIVMAASATASLILLSLLFLPASVTLLFLLTVFLVISISGYKLAGSSLVHEANIDIVASSDTGHRSPLLPWALAALTLLLLIPAAWLFGRAYAAEVVFQQALTHAAKNDGRATYEALTTAIGLNRYKDTYRIVASQTNLLLANSAAAKKDLTAEDRTIITQLIQQAIREAKNAVALNPRKVTNVENLARIYQNLLNFAQGADSWAIASYRQAIALDPVNPTLRISLGGIFYAAKNYEEALRLFQQAAELKPDYGNAYYNLAATYKALNNNKAAYQAMQSVMNNIDKNSADYAKAQTELEALAKLANEPVPTPAPTAETGTELQAPKPQPTAIVNPPLDLPAELGPDTTVTPTPTTTPLNSPTPTPTPSI